MKTCHDNWYSEQDKKSTTRLDPLIFCTRFVQMLQNKLPLLSYLFQKEKLLGMFQWTGNWNENRLLEFENSTDKQLSYQNTFTFQYSYEINRPRFLLFDALFTFSTFSYLPALIWKENKTK